MGASELQLGIRLTADSKGLVGEVRVSKAELDKLTGATRATGVAAQEAAGRTGALTSSLGKLAAGMAAGMLGANAISSALSMLKSMTVALARDSALMAARFETLGVAMTTVGKSAGYNAQEMNTWARGVQAMGITALGSREAVMQLAQAGIHLSQSADLARIAQNAAVIANVNSSQALATLIHGIRSAQTDVLRTIGINVNFEDSYRRLARQLGVTSESLSETQRMQARLAAVMESGTQIAGTYEAAMTTAGKQLTSLARYADDAKTTLGQVFNDALIASVASVTGGLKSLNQEADALSRQGALKQWSRDLALGLAAVADNIHNAVAAYRILQLSVGGISAQAQLMAARGAELDLLESDNLSYEEKLRRRAEIERRYAQLRRDAMGAMSEAQADIFASEDRFQKALKATFDAQDRDAAERNQKLAGRAQEYLGKQKAVAAAYAGASLEIQRAAQVALARGMYPEDYPSAAPRPDGGGGAAAAKSEYDALIKSIRERIAVAELEVQTTEHLTEGQKLAAKIMGGLRDSTIQLTAAEKINLTAKLNRLISVEKGNLAAAAAAARANKEAEDAIAIDERLRLAVEESYGATRKTIEQIEFETQLLGLNNTEREIAIALRDLETRGIEKGSAAYEEFARRLRAVLAARGVRQGQVDAAREAREDWKRTVDNIDKTFRDGFTRMLESGKSGWKAWTESLRNTFRTEVADQIYRMFARPIVLQIVAAVGGALGLSGMVQAANAAGVGGAGGGGLSSLSSLTSLFGGNSIGQGLMSAGDWMVRNNVLSSLGWKLSANAGMIPNWQYGLAGIGGGLLGGLIGGKTGSMLGGIGGGIGMAFGPWGALAGSVGGGILGKVFGGSSGPKKVGHRLVGELSMEDFIGQGYKLYKGGKQKPYGAGTDYMAWNWGGKEAVAAFSVGMREILDYGKQLGLNTSELAKTLAAIRVPIDISKSKNEMMAPKFLAAANAAADALKQQFIPALQQAAEMVKQLGARETEMMTRDFPNLIRDVRGKLGIDTLLEAQRGLAISEIHSPLDRVSAARSQLQDFYSRGVAGDLTAVNAFPQMLQSALSIGRDAFASGSGFQDIFLEGNKMLNELLSHQRGLETDILADVPLTIKEAAQDQIAELKSLKTVLVAELRSIQSDLQRLREVII